MKRTALAPCLFLSLCLPLVASPAAYAQSQPAAATAKAPESLLSLEAQASAEVPQDVIHITLFYEQQGNDPAQLSEILNQRTAQALHTADTAGHDGVTIRTGTLSVAPSTDRDGKISGWRGRSELVLASHDFAAAARLAGQLSDTMQIGGVAFSLSPEAEHAAQAKLSLAAIANFRQQAQAAAQAFGYGNYVVRNVQLNRSNGSYPRPMMMAARAVAANDAGGSLPVEAGDQTVTVTVSGSVALQR